MSAGPHCLDWRGIFGQTGARYAPAAPRGEILDPNARHDFTAAIAMHPISWPATV
jgi:hypothetical protein